MKTKDQVTLPDPVLSQLGEFIEKQFGLQFPKERHDDIEWGLRAACQELGCGDAGRYAGRLLSSAASLEELQAFACHLTVGETYFFRDQGSLAVFEEHIIPTLAKRPLRIWSAGCATGQEPYSIAMLLSRLQIRNSAVLATDLNVRSLAKASEGIYGAWSFRGTPQWAKTRYFSEVARGRWALDPSIRKMVAFAYANLSEDSPADWTSAVDVIFCRNVLMYLSPEAARKAVRRLHRSLNEGGWLIVSPAETSHTLFSEFTSVSFPNATLYRKACGHSPAPAALEERRPPPEKLDHIPLQDLPRDDARLTERDRSKAMFRLARSCANRGNLREALRWCEKLIATGKGDSGIYYLRAAILEEQGALEEASRALRRALYLNPAFAIGHYALGNLAVKRGRGNESAKHFENALHVLEIHGQDDILPESGGLTVGRFRDLITRRIHQ